MKAASVRHFHFHGDVQVNESQPEPPDDALVAAMGRQEEDLEAAKAAFRVFFDRHCDNLLKRLQRVNYQFDGFAIDIEDVVQDVFKKVWDSGHVSYDAARRTNGANAQTSTGAWLTQIAFRVVQNHIRNTKKSITPVDPGPDNEDLFAEPWAADQVMNMVALHQFVESTLSKEDADIVWFKMFYYDPETGKSTPDPEALRQFCEEYRFTDEAFRQRYSRAIKALKQVATTVQL